MTVLRGEISHFCLQLSILLKCRSDLLPLAALTFFRRT